MSWALWSLIDKGIRAVSSIHDMIGILMIIGGFISFAGRLFTGSVLNIQERINYAPWRRNKLLLTERDLNKPTDTYGHVLYHRWLTAQLNSNVLQTFRRSLNGSANMRDIHIWAKLVHSKESLSGTAKYDRSLEASKLPYLWFNPDVGRSHFIQCFPISAIWRWWGADVETVMIINDI